MRVRDRRAGIGAVESSHVRVRLRTPHAVLTRARQSRQRDSAAPTAHPCEWADTTRLGRDRGSRQAPGNGRSLPDNQKPRVTRTAEACPGGERHVSRTGSPRSGQKQVGRASLDGSPKGRRRNESGSTEYSREGADGGRLLQRQDERGQRAGPFYAPSPMEGCCTVKAILALDVGKASNPGCPSL